MATQRQRSQDHAGFKVDYSQSLNVDGETEFVGYEADQAAGSIVAILVEGESAAALEAGQSGVVILDRTPFYGESGGQVGDCGRLLATGGQLDVTDTTKAQGHHLHHVTVTAGSVKVGDSVDAQIDAQVRNRTRLNHSATHLLHEALRRAWATTFCRKARWWTHSVCDLIFRMVSPCSRRAGRYHHCGE